MYDSYSFVIDGKTLVFYVYKGGNVVQVLDDKFVSICSSGKSCLDAYIEGLMKILKIETVIIEGVTYIFTIFKNGEVTDQFGKLVCASNGEICLQKYIDSLINKYTVIEYTVKDITYIFYVYE